MATNPYINRVDIQRGGTTETLINISDTTATAADVSQGKYFYLASGEKVEGTSTGGTMVIRDSQDSHGGTVREITAGTVVQGTKSITANGSYDVAAYADALVDVPSAEPELQSKTATPTESQQTVTPDSGYDGLSSVTVGAISSTYVGSGITRRTSSDLTASGATVTVPSGYYSAQASKAVSSGTAGTPTATKGTVSNHSVSVTPSVTNTTGYITGGTKTGTAVTVAASELVSGTLSITSSGTKDVTNYASASVAAGSATASATKGSVSNHSVTVTPSVTRTAGYVTAGTADGTAVTVSASELVSGSQTITENGTVDVTNLASVDVDVQASGGSSYTFIYSTTMSVSTSSTTAISLDDVATGDTSIWTSSQMVYAKVRDTAGPRDGYFYGTDCMFTINAPAMGLSATSNYLMFGQIYKANALGVLSPTSISRTTNGYVASGYGVYPIRVNSDGRIEMKARYDSTNTGTIDGTFSVEVYLLGWPNDESPLYGN